VTGLHDRQQPEDEAGEDPDHDARPDDEWINRRREGEVESTLDEVFDDDTCPNAGGGPQEAADQSDPADLKSEDAVQISRPIPYRLEQSDIQVAPVQ